MAPTPETVRVYTVDENNDALAGILVRVFDAAGATFITQGYTSIVGADAYAEFTLDGDTPPISYTIRLSKTGVAFDGSLGDDSKSAQLIDIYSPATGSPTGTNNFKVQGQTFTLPVSPDTRLCRASGFFRDGAGRPYANVDIFFIAQFRPAIVDGDAVLGERVMLRTDAAGYAQVDLFRNGEYRATIQSLEDYTKIVMVPDRGSVNIVDLLFPVVEEIDWGMAALSLAVDEVANLTPVVYGSDFRVLTGVALEDVLYAVEDPTVARVETCTDKVIVTGLTPGTTNLKATRLDQSVVVIPASEITNYLLPLTVT